jgi:DedD protein
MASPATTETMEIRRRGRRRLLGAIAIVVLLVVFVPMILDSEPHRAANEPSTVIPPRDNAPPLPPPSKAAPKVTPMPAPAVVPPAPAVVTPAAPPKVAASKLQGFAVQVGAFRDEETLRQARTKLVDAKVAHYTEQVGGGLTRLRAGPFPTREAAEQARVALKLSALDGQVVPLP